MFLILLYNFLLKYEFVMPLPKLVNGNISYTKSNKSLILLQEKDALANTNPDLYFNCATVSLLISSQKTLIHATFFSCSKHGDVIG